MRKISFVELNVVLRDCPRMLWLAGSEACLAGSWALKGGWTDVRMYGQTDGKFSHSTGLRSLLGPLPKNQQAMVYTVIYLNDSASQFITEK